jgi:phosphoribosylanthranilate isomerase
MSKIGVQIYEIQSPQEAEAVVSLGVDRIGSVIVSPEKWKLPLIREAILVSKGAGAKHSVIPLFNDLESLFRVVDFYEPDILHFCESLFHGDGRKMALQGLLDIQYSVKRRFPDLQIMRSIPISSPKTRREVPALEIAEYFAAASDYFLTDTWLGKEPVEGFVGITGQTCDWDTAKRLVECSTIPVIVAGGLSPDNVYEAVMATGARGVDSCTRTNKQDGQGKPVRFKKDLQKVKRFVEEFRRAENDIAGTGF